MKFDKNTWLEQIIFENLFEQEKVDDITSKIQQKLQKPQQKFGEKILVPIDIWRDQQLNNKSKRYVNKLNKYKIVNPDDISATIPESDLVAGDLNGFTIRSVVQDRAKLLNAVSNNEHVGSNSMYANGDYVYIEFLKLTGQRDVLIVPKELTYEYYIEDFKSKDQSKNDYETINVENIQPITTTYTLNDKEMSRTISADQIRKFIEDELKKPTAERSLENFKERFWNLLGDKHMIDKSATQQIDMLYFDHIESVTQLDTVTVAADNPNFNRIGKSKYMTLKQYKDRKDIAYKFYMWNKNPSLRPAGLDEQANPDPKTGVDPEVANWKSNVPNKNWKKPEPSSTLANLNPVGVSCDAWMNITGNAKTASESVTITPKFTELNKACTEYNTNQSFTAADWTIVGQINTKMFLAFKTFFTAFFLGGDASKNINTFCSQFSSWVPSVTYASFPFNFLPTGIEFGDKEEACYEAWKKYWGKLIAPVNKHWREANVKHRSHPVLRYNTCCFNLFYDFASVGFLESRSTSTIFKATFVGINDTSGLAATLSTAPPYDFFNPLSYTWPGCL